MVFTLIILSGCSSNQYAVTYATDPSGAQLYCNGKAYGYTPVTLYYTLSKENKEKGTLNTAPCGVRWASGATAQANNRFNLNQFPKGVQTTMSRPNVGGYAVDAEFALKVQQFKHQQAQDAAAAQQRTMDSINNLNRQLRDNRTKTTTCTEVYGSVVCTTN